MPAAPEAALILLDEVADPPPPPALYPTPTVPAVDVTVDPLPPTFEYGPYLVAKPLSDCQGFVTLVAAVVAVTGKPSPHTIIDAVGVARPPTPLLAKVLVEFKPPPPPVPCPAEYVVPLTIIDVLPPSPPFVPTPVEPVLPAPPAPPAPTEMVYAVLGDTGIHAWKLAPLPPPLPPLFCAPVPDLLPPPPPPPPPKAITMIKLQPAGVV